MEIIIGADIVPTESNIEFFKNGDANTLIGRKLKNILDNADIRIFNLETPLTENISPIKKHGPNLWASVEAINGYKAIGTNILTLANNHILDQDIQGLLSTINILKENNITYLGVGNDPLEASKPYIFGFCGKRIGLYACAEHEFSIVTNNSWGANPFDPLESPDHIVELKKKCDYIIVLYHGGKEYYRYPSPDLQKICRKLINKGADLIICQHTHCIGSMEEYNNGTIVYGQGNFLFDQANNEYVNTSLLVSVNDKFTVSFIPLVKYDNCVRLADKTQAIDILADFKKRSECIKNKDYVERKYNDFVSAMKLNYFYSLSSRCLLFKIMNKLKMKKIISYMLKYKFNDRYSLMLKNYIECESHRELLIKCLELR